MTLNYFRQTQLHTKHAVSECGQGGGQRGITEVPGDEEEGIPLRPAL